MLRRILCLVGLLALPTALLCQEVTLPLAQYEELRERAKPTPEPKVLPPADYALESAQIDVVAGPRSARVSQRLTLSIYAADWLSVPLPTAGSLTSSQLGLLDGRVKSDEKATTLVVRGRGRHAIRLESVVPLVEDKTAARLSRALALPLPLAAVVTGSIAASDSEIQEITVAAGGLPRGVATASRVEFVGTPGAVFSAILLGKGRAVDATRLPLKFRASSAARTEAGRSRMRVHGTLSVEVLSGQLDRLDVGLPEGFEVASVMPADLGWQVVEGRLVLTPVASAEKTLVAQIELASEAKMAFASPLLVPRGAAQLTLLSAVNVAADGLPELTDPGSARSADDVDLAALPDDVRRSGAAFFVVRDPLRPPRWGITWSEEAKVLAAQVDRLLVNMVVGTADRCAYEFWAVVRSSGTTQIDLKLPEGLELLSIERDGRDVQPGTSERGLTVPLAAGTGAQVIHVSGLMDAVALPEQGEFSIPVPGSSAPIARVEVRAALPPGRRYALAQKDRQGAVGDIPTSAPRGSEQTAADGLATLALRKSAAARARDVSFVGLAGAVLVDAVWSALSEKPGAVVIQVKPERRKEGWF
jgi:hypothetical protein